MSFARLEEFIFAKMAETKLPELSAAVVKGNEVIWTKTFGFRTWTAAVPQHPTPSMGSVPLPNLSLLYPLCNWQSKES
jgi:hypothetical protein